MVSLEQVQLLETKVARAIEYVKRVTEENTSLVSENSGLMNKLESTQKRLDELELLIMRFKEDQGRIEDGIMAALDRLSQFEEAFENSLKEKSVSVKKTPVKKQANSQDSNANKFFEITDTIENPDNTKSVTQADSESDKGSASSSPKSLDTGADNGELDIF